MDEKWIYGRTNAYDFVAKITGDTARVLTQNEDFPKLDGFTEKEMHDAVMIFMADVIDWDYSAEWDEVPADELLDGAEFVW